MFSRDIRQRVDLTVAQVMAVAADLERMPEWASGLSSNAQVEFSIDVERGILDHEVTLPDGSVVPVRLRVEPRGTGSEIVFTLVRQPGMTDDQWRADADAVAADLRRLAALCEKIVE
ncbi:SRPBCC family protein [Microcella sp.]|uniref:SRPBCC family protein n=1 Tax=Microcella sp. TaxID=1913979 RepID=UPI0025670118|nr:SRPBCC family protein [Microcella sp.]MBX9471505.1 SRPBCC family protein [Microcella sp.]